MLDIPHDVATFLDPTQRCVKTSCGKKGSCCRQVRAMNAYILTTAEPIDADHHMVKLILSGMVPACLDVIENHTNRRCDAIMMASRWLVSACNVDRPWYMILAMRGRPVVLNPLVEHHLGISNGFLRSVGAGAVSNTNGEKIVLVDLIRVKVLLCAIDFFGRRNENFHDKTVLAQMTRLVTRCLLVGEHVYTFDRALLQVGLYAVDWNVAAEAAKKEHATPSSAACKYIPNSSIARILAQPSTQERHLIGWLLRTDVSNALEGWFQGGAWKRDVAVGIKASSWKRARALLAVGYRFAMGHMDTTIEQATMLAAAQLLAGPMENRDGSSSNVCSAQGCWQHGEKMQCSRCKHANYCSKDCQTKHWHQMHKQECKKLARLCR